jgi:thioesterase domain-containing protein
VDRLVLVNSAIDSLERPTVLLFPGLGGDEQELAALRSGTSHALRCLTVEYPDWTEIYTKPIDLDGLIAHCVARVNALVPNGSLRLSGYSFGGTMAYAVAVALAKSGRDVARLALLDSPAKPHVSTSPPSLKARGRRFTNAVRDGEIHREIAGTFAGLVMRTGNARLLLALGKLRRFQLPLKLQEHLNKPITCRLRENLLLDLIARMQAEHPPLGVSAVLFRSTRQHLVDAAPDLGWSQHLSSLDIVDLPGDHHTVIKPEHIARLCRVFVEAMADDQSATPAPDRLVKELSV